jgi:class 3 adenylate cyclase/tetratricopeptide (TPR) repeat protein
VTTATVLFCDLVGSTAQRTALGDDAADRLAALLDSMLRDAVDRHRGSVVKSTGDGLMAVFDATSDAVSAAVEAHQVTDLHNRQAEVLEHLVLRIGISAGDVHFVAHDCHGTPVVEAARLESAAEPGTILVSSLAQALAGSRGGHRFDPVGMLELKGLEPVAAFRAHWEPLDVGAAVDGATALGPPPMRVPLPARFDTHPVFVGREKERAALGAALDAAQADGLRRITIVSGEPGIGKTSLAAVHARDAAARGSVVLYGRCDEDRSIPYQPWLDALAHLCLSAPDVLLREHVEERGGELARLVPALAARVDLPARQEVDPETEQYLLFGAVVDLIGRVATYAPLLVVLDDLHWADHGSLRLLKYFAAAERPTRSHVVAIYRDSDVSANPSLRDTLAALYRELGVEIVALDGLDHDGVFELLEASAGHELDEDGRTLRDRLLAETDGNPFFVTETLRHLAETGAIGRDDAGRWSAIADPGELGLPVTVREVVRRRVAHLGEEAQRVLTLAAVIGREFDLGLLSTVTDLSEEVTLDVLEAATTAMLLRPIPDHADRFGFVHALIEHTLHDELSPARQRRAHRRVAEALTTLLGADPADRVGELANHWIAADPEGDEAVDFALEAGRNAIRQVAPQDGVHWFEEALRLLEARPDHDATRRCALLIELGVALRDSGDGRSRAVLLEAAALAREHDAPEFIVCAALANTRGWASSAGALDQERVDGLEVALEAVGPGDSADRARLLATLAAETSYATAWSERVALSDESLAVARRIGDDDALSYVLARRAHSIWVPDTLPERLANTAENLALTARSPNPTARFWAAFYRIAALTSAGDSSELDRHLATLHAIAEEVTLPLLRWETTTQHAWCALVSGRLKEAERLTFAALEAGTASDQPDAGIVFAAAVLLLRFDQGRLDEIVDLLEQAARDTPGIPGLRASLALAYCELDRDDHARTLLLEASDSRFAGVPYDQFWLVSLVQWSLVTGHLREQSAAKELAALLTPWAGQFAFTGAHLFGSVAHALAVCEATLGRYAAATDHFNLALTAYENFGAPGWAARLRLAWADMLRARDGPDDPDQARALTLEAHSVAQRFQLNGIERRASG